MRQTVFAILSAACLLALVLLATNAVHLRNSSAQESVSLAVDADPTGNNATSLAPTDQCVSTATGDSVQVDIVVRDVEDLLGWEAYVIYDASVLELTGRDVRLFLAANSGSNIFDASDAPPDTDGRYRVAAADIADPPAPDSGSGVLARLTFDALSPGVSLIALPRLDLSSDGQPDTGPILTTVGGQRIGDSNGDALFDGLVADAWIAVDTDCPPGPPPLPTIVPFTPVPSTPLVIPTTAATTTIPATLTPTPSAPEAAPGDDDNAPWVLVGGLGGGAIVLLAGALLLWRLRSRRAG